MQIATNAIDEALKAAVMAEEAGASWIDLNCGCPIYGAALNDQSGWLRLKVFLHLNCQDMEEDKNLCLDSMRTRNKPLNLAHHRVDS